MSKFVMPQQGTPEFEQLKARWSAKPVSFGQCTRIKALMRDVLASGGWRGVGPKTVARLDYLSQRDQEGRWTKVRTDSGELTMWQAHLLIESLATMLAGDVTSTKGEPTPVADHKIDPVEVQQGTVLEHGVLVMVRTSTGVETKRVNVVGNRVTLGRP